MYAFHGNNIIFHLLSINKRQLSPLKKVLLRFTKGLGRRCPADRQTAKHPGILYTISMEPVKRSRAYFADFVPNGQTGRFAWPRMQMPPFPAFPRLSLPARASGDPVIFHGSPARFPTVQLSSLPLALCS